MIIYLKLILPLLLCSTKLKSILSLCFLPYFKILLYLTPNIIVAHPVIFIITTISNITILYIVFLNIFDKNINLRENIIHLFNNLKKCKFCPFKFKLLLINIVIHLKEWIYLKFKQLKDN
jgi:hypothetical protein